MLPYGDEAVTIEYISCSESRGAEVSTLVDADSKDAPAPPPGEEALALQAESVRMESFESYVGAPYVLLSLDVTWLPPAKSSQDESNRQIVYLVNAMDAQSLMSSVKDSKLRISGKHLHCKAQEAFQPRLHLQEECTCDALAPKQNLPWEWGTRSNVPRKSPKKQDLKS